jgi:predicted metal-dependent enzyme (double-stranded beta helix superfamily)
MQVENSSSFNMDQFIANCHAALREDRPSKAVREVVARAVSEPAAILRELGEPKRAEVRKLYHSTELTILNLTWAPHMAVRPHNHRMWAVVGIYTGCEDNVFWRRIKGDPNGLLEAAGTKTLAEGDAEPLGPDVIHSVTNPRTGFTGAIHVYGGDLFGTQRSEWDPTKLWERPYSVETTLREFEEANARYSL